MVVSDIIRIIGVVFGIVTMFFDILDNIPSRMDYHEVKKKYKGKDLMLYRLSCITGTVSLILLLVSFIV